MKKLFSFLYWSKWTDLSVFYFGGDTYLCQGRANEITNKRKFRTIKVTSGIGNEITLDTLPNNSWIRVESEKDLPSADCDVFLYFKDGEIMCDRFLLNYKNFATINYIHVSHYQPITKPLQPLH